MRATKAALGIEIRDEEIRLVCLTRGLTRPKLVAATTIPLLAKDISLPNRVEEAVASISEFMRSLSIRPARVVVGFSRKRVFMRTVKLPQVGAEDLPGTIESEMERHIPIPLRDVHLAFKLLRKDQEPGIKAIIVAIQRSLLEAYLALVARAALMVEVVTATSFTKAHLLLRSLSRQQRGKAQVILEREGNDYILEVVRGGEFLLASVFTPFGDEAGHYQQLLDHLAGQFQAMGLSWSQHPEELLNFFYVGSPPEFMKERPIKLGSLEGNVELAPGQDADLPSSAGALSLAFQGLGYFDDGINLIYSRPEVPSRLALAPLLWAAAAIAIAVISVIFVKDYLRDSRELDQLKSQVAQLRPAVTEAQNLNTQLNQIKSRLEQGTKLVGKERSKLELLNELALTIPGNAWLTRISYKGGLVELRGQASSSQELVQLLEKSSLLENVQFDAAITRREAVELFSMKANLEGYPRK